MRSWVRARLSIWSCAIPLCCCLLSGCDERKTVILVADQGNARIVQMDDFSGAGWTTFAYPRANTTLGAPIAIAADSRGRIYASNTGDDNISRMDAIGGNGFVTFGGSGSGTGQLREPSGLAVDAQDRIYVADSANGRIVRVDDISGAGWTELGSPGVIRGHFEDPVDIALDSRGRIYVADRGNRRIVRVDDMSGAGWTTYGGGPAGFGPGRFDILGGIAVATDGRIYVTDSNREVVISIGDMNGDSWAFFGYVGSDSLFENPLGIFVDGASPIYVATLNNNYVDRFQDLGGTGYRTLGRFGTGEREFDGPADVVVASVPK